MCRLTFPHLSPFRNSLEDSISYLKYYFFSILRQTIFPPRIVTFRHKYCNCSYLIAGIESILCTESFFINLYWTTLVAVKEWSRNLILHWRRTQYNSTLEYAGQKVLHWLMTTKQFNLFCMFVFCYLSYLSSIQKDWHQNVHYFLYLMTRS